jgi:CspA family cold shock protein
MATGTVKVYDDERGFGFIQPSHGVGDVFVHIKSVIGASELIPGQMVEYDLTLDPKRGKYRAADVRVI